MPNIRRLLTYMTKYKKHLIFAVVFAVISSIIEVVSVYFIGQATETMVGVGRVDFTNLFKILVIFLVNILLWVICRWLSSYYSNYVSNNTIKDLRIEVFSKMERLPISYFDTTAYGSIINKFIIDLDYVSIALMLIINSFFSGVVVILASSAFMLSIDGISALVVFSMTPITFLVAFIVAKRSRSTFFKQQKEMEEMSGYLEEMVGNEKILKTLQYEEQSEDRFDVINQRFKETNTKAQYASALTNPSARFVNNLSYIFVVLVGAFGALSGRLSFGKITSFLLYSSQFSKPFNEISSIAGQLQTAVASLDRVFLFLDEREERPDKKADYVFSKVKGEVAFENVSFSYTAKNPLMKDVNLLAKPGQTIAIVGPTGAGKTTMVNLLMRFYNIKKGKITVDGVDINRSKRDSLRSLFGMVLQDTWLFSGSIAENIAFSRPDATKEEIIEAARSAYAHGFIKRLKNGYDTILGEDGGSLSAGQRQLLTIARVMLLDPPILILDEATSSIDTLTEQRIQKALNKMMESKTSFVIAHRLSTIVSADVILVLKDGNIIEQGSHDMLIKADGFYKELYTSQFK